MKKYLAFVLAVVMVFAMAACGTQAAPAEAAPAEAAPAEAAPAEAAPAEAAPAEVQKWIFCNCVDETHPQSKMLIKFSDEFNKATNGKYEIDCRFNSTLGSEDELCELTRSNTIQGYYGGVNASLATYMPVFGAFALPYLFHSYDDAYDYINNSDMAKTLFANLEAESGLHFVDMTLNGVRALTTKDTKVTCPDDLKGLKIRSMTAQVWQDVIAALGGTPVPIAYTELYVALQTGVVDGQDNGIANVYNSKFYEVQKYFMKTDHGYTLSSFCLSDKAWASLSDEEKATFMSLWEQYCVDEYAVLMDAYYQEGFDAITAAGCVVVEQDEMDMQAFYDAAASMIDEKYIDDPTFGPIVKDVRTYFGY